MSERRRRDKGKGVQTPADYQIQPFDICARRPTLRPPAPSVHNQFAPITSTSAYPPLTFAEAAAIPKPHQAKPPKHLQTMQTYFKKPSSEYLFQTSLEKDPGIQRRHELVQKTFSKEFHWHSEHTKKTQRFYELILVDSKSALITHNQNPQHEVGYSKCIIQKVISGSQWGEPLFERNFSVQFSPKTYNYLDYKMAWTLAFFYRPGTHSWFFNFHDKCQTEFPIWFYHWWALFGGCYEIFPQEANEGWELWDQKPHSNLKPYQSELAFFRTFNIAWIFCWNYELSISPVDGYPLSMIRTFSVKWWPSYHTNLCGQENVAHYLKHGKKKFSLQDLPLPGNSPAQPKTPVKKEKQKTAKSWADIADEEDREKKKIMDLYEKDRVFAREYLQYLREKQKSDVSRQVTSASSEEASSSPAKDEGPSLEDPFDF